MQEKVFRKLLKKLLKYTAARVATGAGGKSTTTLPLPPEISVVRELNKASSNEEPYAEIEIADEIDELTPELERQYMDELSRDSSFQEALQEVVNGATPESHDERLNSKGAIVLTRTSAETLMSPKIVQELVDDASKTESKGILSSAKFLIRVGKILVRVIKRFATGRHHGVHATVVEEVLRDLYLANIGMFVWERMKKDTGDSFEDVGGDPIRGGWYFVRELGRAISAADTPPKVSVVAHSLGSVYACHLIDHIASCASDDTHPLPADFALENLILLAPAVTFERAAPTFTQHGDRVKHVRMFALKDDLEKGYWEVPVLYPRSLLYIVSGMFERDGDGGTQYDAPLLGMQRYWEGTNVYDQASVKAMRRIFQVESRDKYWSETNEGPGKATNAVRHGGFDDTGSRRATIDSIVEILG